MILRAALFDLDGTLIETHIDFHAMAQAMQDIAQQAGVAPDVFADQDILGIVEASAKEIAERNGDGEEFRRQAFLDLEQREVDGCAHPILLPGTDGLLRTLTDRNIKIGIVTRNCRRVSTELLERFALPYDVLLTRDDVARTKPNPQHLWEALHALECSPEAAVMVGDHWMDIQAGQRANVARTLGVLGSHDADWFAPCPPDVLVHDLSEAGGFFG
jgi:phosphoglycolate phosphatase-like HAD superfamily hydrolase